MQLDIRIMVTFGRKIGGIFYRVPRWVSVTLFCFFIWMFCIWVHWVWYAMWYVNLCIYVVVQWSVLIVWGEFLTGKQDAFSLDAMYYLIEFCWIEDNKNTAEHAKYACCFFSIFQYPVPAKILLPWASDSVTTLCPQDESISKQWNRSSYS